MKNVAQAFGVILFAGALTCSAGFADSSAPGAAPRDWPSRQHSWQPQNPPCTCRAQGREYGVGTRLCMMTHRGGRQAICG
ncbi:MAG: hypothetical protein ACRCXM_10060, partial [Beijerinckiaceae bacterium]